MPRRTMSLRPPPRHNEHRIARSQDRGQRVRPFSGRGCVCSNAPVVVERAHGLGELAPLPFQLFARHAELLAALGKVDAACHRFRIGCASIVPRAPCATAFRFAVAYGTTSVCMYAPLASCRCRCSTRSRKLSTRSRARRALSVWGGAQQNRISAGTARQSRERGGAPELQAARRRQCTPLQPARRRPRAPVPHAGRSAAPTTCEHPHPKTACGKHACLDK